MSKFQLYYMAVVAHYSKARSVPYCRLPIFLELITNMRQPWPFSVTWRHRTCDIRFAISHFLLVVLWNRFYLLSVFWRYWAIGILQYP